MTIYSIFVIFLAVVVFSLSLNVFLKNKEHSNRAFAFTLSMIGMWILSVGLSNLFFDIDTGISALSVRFSYFFGTMVAFAFFYFSLTYADNYKPTALLRRFLFGNSLFIFIFYFYKDLASLFSVSVQEDTIVTTVYKTMEGSLGWYSGKYIVFFFIFFFGTFSAALATLWQKYQKQTEERLQKQTLFVFWVITAGAVPSGFLNTILPWFGIFDYVWMGVVLTTGWVITIWYWMFRFEKSNTEVLDVLS